VYRGFRITRQPLATSADGNQTTTYTFTAHPRQTAVSANSLDEIRKLMDAVLDARP